MDIIFSLCSIILSLMFLLESSPLFLSLMIILQTITLALIITLFTMSSWFSFMLLMIYLSGMMIVFVYISSIASNELFSSNWYLIPLALILLLPFMILLLSSHSPPLSDSLSLLDSNLSEISIIKTMKMYSKSLFTMTILMIIYLLLAMIMVTKNSSFSGGPMRSAK
uniref:NADH-ubiquinone oxidoreductase chain 6 n=1 Tax=Pseudoniphargus daviui TaxID=1041814 RepID=K7ZU05_9CRUS|nr:NADH dehydrogenase subunit 6 [Pseudoniphargus daviui]CCB84639.2 NADH dehydrogenase subunit 6 [Pseudoniphargus daviui]